MRSHLVAAILLLVSTVTRADEEASNVAHVVTSEFGRCYAKSIPSEPYGKRGRTNVYLVQSGDDVLVRTFDWFSQRLYVECNVSPPSGPVGISVVRLGPWARGHEAANEDLALAFYFDGELKKEYSTLDLAGAADNVSLSASHYTVIESVDGFQWSGEGNRYRFVIHTFDDRTLTFDPTTGEELQALPKVSHQPFPVDDYGDRIVLSPFSGASDPTSSDDRVYTTHRNHWFVVRRPDHLKSGPWNTKVIIGDDERPLVVLAFRDHGSSAVSVAWINEKLLFAQVWWGRIAATDVIVDVAAQEFVYREWADYGQFFRPGKRR